MANRHAWRGFMLDAARHFMPVDDVLRLIDAAALCGVNVMHWHLADDQGWRVEIERFPELTRVGAFRGASHFGTLPADAHNDGFYTAGDVRRVVEHAGARGIEVVPEIDLPGHSSTLLAAYPQYGCRRTVTDGRRERYIEKPYKYDVLGIPGIFPNLVCAGSDAAVGFLEDVLDELIKLFPGRYFHIGGDEAVKLHWRRCPDCRRRMEGEGLPDAEALQRWLVLRLGQHLHDRGKRPIVWNDALAGGPLPDWFVVQQWAGDGEQARRFMAEGGQVIWSEVGHFYLDYPYSAIDVHHIWALPDVPAFAEGHEDKLLGVECPLWTEYVPDVDRAGYLLFPRLAAAGLRFGGGDFPTWEGFRDALKETQARVAALGLEGAPEAYWRMTPEDAARDREAEALRRRSPETDAACDAEARLLMQEDLERLLYAIRMPWGFALRVMDAAWRRVPEYCGADASAGGDGAEVMADQLLTAVRSRRDGAWRDLPEDVWLDTMAAYPRFVNEHRRSYGRYGFDRGFWTTRHAGARLFRVGALEYELKDGEVGLHIPSDIALDMDALDASVAAARDFLGRFFPEWRDAPMTCETWLLSPKLDDLLPDASRIRAFRRAFDLLSVDPGDDDAVEWVFNVAAGQRDALDFAALPEDTALRRGMKALLLRDEKPGAGKGRLARGFRQ